MNGQKKNYFNNKIICVEASPSCYNLLQNNLKNYENIICLNYAVCDTTNNTTEFYEAINCNTISTLNVDWLSNDISRFNGTPYNKIIVNAISIDKLIELYGMPDLIKIDVEGAEYNCIKSLNIKVKCICFEWASEMREIIFKCLDYLNKLGYTQFYCQYGDAYDFRPNIYDDNIESLTQKILNTTPKKEWGMIWCN